MKSCHPVVLAGLALALLCGVARAQSTASPYPAGGVYPYDNAHGTSQPLAAGTDYVPAGDVDGATTYWGWQCRATSGPGLAFGGNSFFEPDARPHTRVLESGNWVRIDSLLRAANPLQAFHARARLLRERLKDALARARYVFFEGRTAATEAIFLADSVNPELNAVSSALTQLAADLSGLTGLGAYEKGQADWAAATLAAAAANVASIGTDAAAAELTALRAQQVAVEIASEALDAEPPARVLSMIAWDPVTSLFVVFGGDHVDYLTNDLWVFDPAARKWMQRRPADSPAPRGDHWFVPNDSGKIRMRGGYTYSNKIWYASTQYMHMGPAEWTYDVAGNTWQNPSGAPAFPADTRVYRTDPYTPEFYAGGSKPDAAANASVLSGMAVNTWVSMNPPFIYPRERDWGTVAYDPDRDMVYVYSGGHCVYTGTDVLHYHLASNRYEQPVPTEEPLGLIAASGKCVPGWSLNLRPWMTNHTWNGYEYDPVLKKMVVVGRSDMSWGSVHDEYMYVYDPDRAEWESRHPISNMPHDRFDVQACWTPQGLVSWCGQQIWRMNESTLQWSRLAVTGTVPVTVVDYCGIVYDSKRGRVIMASAGGYEASFNGKLHSLDPSANTVTAITPLNIDMTFKAYLLREVVYLPDDDLYLWTVKTPAGGCLVYDPNANMWFSAAISGGAAFNCNSGLVYDGKRKLVWHFNQGSGAVHALKFSKTGLSLQPVGGWKLSGTVTGATGASMTLTGADTVTKVTDAGGGYYFGAIDGSWRITPYALGFAFTPAFRDVTVRGADVPELDFTATAAAVRTVTASAGTGGTISPAGATRVNDGGSLTYAITPSHGYRIADVLVNSVSQGAVAAYTFNNITSDQTISVSFSALPTYAVSGTVTGNVVEGVRMTLSGDASDTVFTDASGVYAFSGVYDGAYGVTPFAADNAFTPATASVTVSGGNRTGVNFTSTASADLVLWLKLDGNTADSSACRNHGTAYGGPAFISGPRDSGLVFDGGDHIDCGTGASLAINGAVTVMAFVRVNGTGDWPRIVQRGEGDGIGYALRLDGLRFVFQANHYSGGYNARADADAAAGRWYHVAGVYDGANPPRIYVNGVLQSGMVDDDPGSSGTALSIGRRAGSSSQYFTGALDDIRIYKRGLTRPEIDSLSGGFTAAEISAMAAGEALRIHPSPFNSSTQIAVSGLNGLKRPAEVTLAVYDVRGRLVRDFSREAKNAASRTLVRWDAGGLPSDVYFVKLRLGEKHFIRKAVLMR